MKTEKKSAVFPPSSPIRLFLILLMALFGSELLIMFIFLPILFGKVEGVVPNIADSSLLTLMIAPYLWFGVVRPLRHAAGRLDEELKKKVEELVEAQEELVRKEKLATLGQIAGSVGHELRNPLGVMNNAVYFLKTVLSDSDEAVKEYLDILKVEIDASERILGDLLDFSRIKTPQVKPVTAKNLISQSIEKCTVPENVTVDIDIPEALPVITADPFQMGQVFQNLITNAFQAMPGGGVLRIAARKVSSLETGDRKLAAYLKTETRKLKTDFIEISVTDTGKGIQSENMKKLFQPLFTTKAKGIGLGLVVCKNLTEANGGRIGVESRLGAGTTFNLVLPAAEGAV